MGFTNFPNGITSFGVPLPSCGSGAGIFGKVYFVDQLHVRSNDGNQGISTDRPLKTIQAAVTKARDNDTIYVAPAVYTENIVTLDDLYSRNVSLIGCGGASMPGWDEGVRIVPSTTSSPCLQIKASGWKVSGICFWPGATSSGIEFYADMTSANFRTGTVAGSLCRGGEVSNCLFWGNSTGKYGIVWQGVTGTQAPASQNIWNNKFAYLAATAASGIWIASGGNPVYNLQIIGNQFESCRAAIDTYASMGIVGSRITDNTFGTGGTYSSATTCLVDVSATATPAVTGGNHFYRNGLGCTKAVAAAGTYILLNGYDNAGGNYCSDGIDSGIYKAS